MIKVKPKERRERDRRIGRFSVSEVLIEQEPELFKKHIMAQMIVVRAEMVYMSRTIEYTSICDLFEELPQGYVPPEYSIWVTKGDDGEVSVEAKKVIYPGKHVHGVEWQLPEFQCESWVEADCVS
jgi:hypothetical protein